MSLFALRRLTGRIPPKLDSRADCVLVCRTNSESDAYTERPLDAARGVVLGLIVSGALWGIILGAVWRAWS
jgi:hypothetical protein